MVLSEVELSVINGTRVFSNFSIETPERLQAIGKIIEAVEAHVGERLPSSDLLDSTLISYLRGDVLDLDQTMMHVGAAAVLEACRIFRTSSVLRYYVAGLARFHSVPSKIAGNSIDSLMIQLQKQGNPTAAEELYGYGREQGVLRQDTRVLHCLGRITRRLLRKR